MCLVYLRASYPDAPVYPVPRSSIVHMPPLVHSIPGASTDVGLMAYTFASWLPQRLSAPLSSETWHLLTSLVPWNEQTPAEVQWAQQLAEAALAAKIARRKARGA